MVLVIIIFKKSRLGAGPVAEWLSSRVLLWQPRVPSLDPEWGPSTAHQAMLWWHPT